MGNLFPMKIGNGEGWQWNKKDVLFMSDKTIYSWEEGIGKLTLWFGQHIVASLPAVMVMSVARVSGREGQKNPLYRTITPLPVSYRGMLDLTLKLQCHVWLPGAHRAGSWGRGLHQRYPHLFPSGSMALEERLFSFKMTFDKWGRNNHHIQKANQASQEICM